MTTATCHGSPWASGTPREVGILDQSRASSAVVWRNVNDVGEMDKLILGKKAGREGQPGGRCKAPTLSPLTWNREKLGSNTSR